MRIEIVHHPEDRHGTCRLVAALIMGGRKYHLQSYSRQGEFHPLEIKDIVREIAEDAKPDNVPVDVFYGVPPQIEVRSHESWLDRVTDWWADRKESKAVDAEVSEHLTALGKMEKNP